MMMMMMKNSIAVVAVVIVLLAASAKARKSSEHSCSLDCKHHKKCSPTRATPEFAVLAIENVVVYCKKNRCAHKPNVDWSLHGLWPSEKVNDPESGRSSHMHHSKHVHAPVYCDLSSSFEKDSVKDLRSTMKTFWSSLKDNSDTTFWTHEWCKHGTCAVASQDFPSITDQHSYFQKALELFQQVNVGDSLRGAGISSNTTVKEITSIFKTKPKLGCEQLDDGKQVLETMEFCYTTRDFEPIPCQLEWDAKDTCKDGAVLLKY